jgi:hypothetical protein
MKILFFTVSYILLLAIVMVVCLAVIILFMMLLGIRDDRLGALVETAQPVVVWVAIITAAVLNYKLAKWHEKKSSR